MVSGLHCIALSKLEILKKSIYRPVVKQFNLYIKILLLHGWAQKKMWVLQKGWSQDGQGPSPTSLPCLVYIDITVITVISDCNRHYTPYPQYRPYSHSSMYNHYWLHNHFQIYDHYLFYYYTVPLDSPHLERSSTYKLNVFHFKEFQIIWFGQFP